MSIGRVDLIQTRKITLSKVNAKKSYAAQSFLGSAADQQEDQTSSGKKIEMLLEMKCLELLLI